MSCGESAGFSITQKVGGTVSLDFDEWGNEGDNTDMYDGVIAKSNYSYAECSSCNGKYAKVIDLEKDLGKKLV